MRKLLLLILLVAFKLSCWSQVLVSYDKSKDLDMSQYKTFKIVKLDIKTMPDFEPKQEGISQFMQQVTNKMRELGYEPVEDNADLLINFGVTIQEQAQTRETSIRDAPRYIGQRNYHWESEEIVIGYYKEGTVTMDLVDSQKDEMIWQAVVRGVVQDKEKGRAKRIARSVEKLFKKFPE
ncbi:MAG: DUF4136 domain-containing protein [Cyclobacteriaceae bacterium]|nr:DUF4136 domain-containing protein [Cyclobacteriaceae bacterium]